MFRSFLLSACLLGLFTTAEAVAAPTAANPNRRILPGNHRPVYKTYGHHGLFENGLFGAFRRTPSAKPTNKAQVAKKHRGTL